MSEAQFQTELTEVIYNAAEQAFQARVTVYDGGRRYTYPCAIAAPIGTSHARAARALVLQALRRHGKPQALRSVLTPPQANVLRAARRLLRRGLPLGEYGFHRGRAA